MKKSEEITNISRIVSAFPGCGKSYMAEHFTEYKIIDLECTSYRNSENFAKDYLEAIKENIGKVDIILITSHQEIREALLDSKLQFIEVYPSDDMKEEMIERYVSRGSDESFIENMKSNWDNFIHSMKNDPCPYKIVLNSGEYLSDIFSGGRNLR